MGKRTLVTIDLAVKVGLIGLLLHAVLNPDLPQYHGKAMAGRALTFPIAAVVIPAIWWLRFRHRPFPALIDLMVTAPFLIDVVGNALGLYDSIDWWDDANHFVNWGLLAAGAALALKATGLGQWNRLGLAVGFAAVAAIGWELAEYVTFIRFSPELATAYTDTLGDLTLGTFGGFVGAVLVESMSKPDAVARLSPSGQPE